MRVTAEKIKVFEVLDCYMKEQSIRTNILAWSCESLCGKVLGCCTGVWLAIILYTGGTADSRVCPMMNGAPTGGFYAGSGARAFAVNQVRSICKKQVTVQFIFKKKISILRRFAPVKRIGKSGTFLNITMHI